MAEAVGQIGPHFKEKGINCSVLFVLTGQQDSRKEEIFCIGGYGRTKNGSPVSRTAIAVTKQRGSLPHHLGFDEVGGALDAQGDPGGDDDRIAGLDKSLFSGGIHAQGQQPVGGVHRAIEKGLDAPGDGQLPPDLLGGGEGHNGAGGAETGDDPGGVARGGGGQNGGGVQLHGGHAAGVADGAVDGGGTVTGEVLPLAEVAAPVVGGVLGGFYGADHGLQRLQRVFARGGLAGEHG